MKSDLNAIYGALSDSTRRDILQRLSHSDCSISELAKAYDMSLAGVSKHIKVLNRAGMVETIKEGRVHHCRFKPDPLRAGINHLEQYAAFWNDRLDALEQKITSKEKHS